jgi:hypothetical protein
MFCEMTDLKGYIALITGASSGKDFDLLKHKRV